MFKMKRGGFSDNEDFGVRSAEQLVFACLDGFVRFRFRSIFDLQSYLFVDVLKRRSTVLTINLWFNWKATKLQC